MKILVITASLPYPPASGGALRAYGILKGLGEFGHEVTLLSFHDGRVSPETTPLAECCQKIVTVEPPMRTKMDRLRTLLTSRQPDIARRLYSESMADALRNLLTTMQFDVIQFEAIEVVCYLPLAKQLQPTAKLVFDTFNAEYLLQRAVYEVDREEFKRWLAAAYSWIQSRRIERYEREMCQLADAVIAVSPEDADALRPFRKDKQVHIVPSGIFVDDYANAETSIDLAGRALVFTGKMDYRPNVDAVLWFTEHILPSVQRTIDDVRLYVVGQQPHARLDVLRENDSITLTGWVDSVTPYLYGADVYVAPLRMGSGTRLKLLEAMACKRAIVATTTAAAGLSPEVKSAMCISDDPDSFAQTINTLLHDADQRQKLGETAHQQVRAHYDWSVLIPRLLTVYDTLFAKVAASG